MAEHPEGKSVFDREPDRTLAGESLPVSFFAWRSEHLFVVEPPGRPAANVVYSHGLTDHAARHLPTAAWLAGAGYRVILFDLAGHGGQGQPLDGAWRIKEAYAAEEDAAAVGSRIRDLRLEPAFSERFQDRRYRVLKETRMRGHLAQLDGIVGQLATSSRFAGGELPLILVGHSVGGLLCAESAWRWRRRPPADLRGVVLLNPALRPRARPGSLLEEIAVDAFWALRRFPPWFLPASVPRAGAKSVFELDLPIDTTWGNPWLSDQQEEVDLYDSDPLTPRAVPSRYASSIESQMVASDRRTAPFPVDALVVLPGTDGITSVEGGLDFARKARAAKLSLVRFGEACAHDLMRSSERSAVRETVDDWIRRRL